MKQLKLHLTLFLASLFCATLASQDSSLIYKIDIKREIGSTSWLYLDNGMTKAEELKADLIILHINTYGGQVVFADSMRTRILNSKTPIYAFIDNNAASAGALISIACDTIYMRPGASIGAATVVNEGGEAAPDKYQSYMRSMMRATAESHGKVTTINGNDTIRKWFRNPAIAEAMVDQSIYVAGVSDTGKVLTFTALEAIENGFCEDVAENIDELLIKSGHKNYKYISYKSTVYDDIKGFLINPVIHGILIMLIIGGIYFEMQSPGIGFPLAAAILGAILYFAPLYIDGLAAYWEVAIFIIGIVLIMLEVFVIPGFGIAGVSGIFLVIAGLVLSMLGNVMFDFTNVAPGETIMALLTVFLSIIIAFAASIFLTSKLLKNNRIFSAIALTASQDIEAGFVGVDTSVNALIGKKGSSLTVLRPSGRITIDNEVYDAISKSDFIDKNCDIIVVAVDASQVIVEAI